MSIEEISKVNKRLDSMLATIILEFANKFITEEKCIEKIRSCMVWAIKNYLEIIL